MSIILPANIERGKHSKCGCPIEKAIPSRVFELSPDRIMLAAVSRSTAVGRDSSAKDISKSQVKTKKCTIF